MSAQDAREPLIVLDGVNKWFGDLHVLKVARDLKPWRMAGARGAKVVLELAAGAADVREGDQLTLDG